MCEFSTVVSREALRLSMSPPIDVARRRESESMIVRMIPVCLIVSALISSTSPIRELVVMPVFLCEKVLDIEIFLIARCLIHRDGCPVSRIELIFEKIDTRMSNHRVLAMEILDIPECLTSLDMRKSDNEVDRERYACHISFLKCTECHEDRVAITAMNLSERLIIERLHSDGEPIHPECDKSIYIFTCDILRIGLDRDLRILISWKK
jgi:predicted metal-binding protein